MTIEKKLLGTSPSGGDAQNVADVFSTYLYEGTGAIQTITNGIDLAGEGGMVWIKRRGLAFSHVLADSERSDGTYLKNLSTNNTNVESTTSADIRSFNSDGFEIGDSNGVGYTTTYASWTFRKAPRFFDVVTYTGDGVAGREVAHDLGVTPAMIIVKSSSDAEQWRVYHTSLGATKALALNSTSAASTSILYWNDTDPTSTEFSVGAYDGVNGSNKTYVAYLFAHDPDGENDDGMIACGSYTGNGNSASREMNVGWEVQYVLIKDTSVSANWMIFDTTRGMAVTGSQPVLYPNETTAEIDYISVFATANGFGISGEAYSPINGSGNTYIYMAIRAPMMKEPEAGTEVFAVQKDVTVPSQISTGFALDATLSSNRSTSTPSYYFTSRLTNGAYLTTQTNAAENAGSSYWQYDQSDGLYQASIHTSSNVWWMFKRAKGFFDVVTYTGTRTTETENHSLGVVPEMMIHKNRSAVGTWYVYHSEISPTYHLRLDSTTSKASSGGWLWNNTAPTDTVFTRDSDSELSSYHPFITYLFATLAGVSKVGSYTGNGSSQNIACGFSAGARFVLIKRTDSTGDWYVWDTERGIVAGNDPHLSPNTAATEVTTDDSIDPQSAGFTVNQVTATNINVSSGEYIFLAIA